MNVNLHGTRRLAEATVPGMVAAGRGRFVAIASAAALRAMPQLAAYSAAKAAAVGYVRALAADLAGTGRVGQRGLSRVDARRDARGERRASTTSAVRRSSPASS